jgi:hypothetical protein
VCGNWKDTKFTSPLTWAPDLFRLCLVGIRMKVWCVRVMCLIQHNIVFACLVYAVCWLSVHIFGTFMHSTLACHHVNALKYLGVYPALFALVFNDSGIALVCDGFA